MRIVSSSHQDTMTRPPLMSAQLIRLGSSSIPKEGEAPKTEPLYGGQIRPKRGQVLQPDRTPASQHCLNALLTVNGMEALTLFDTGSTLDSICSDFALSANISSFKLERALDVQLGMKGSHSRVTAGAWVNISVLGTHFPLRFVDVSNIDKYQLILGTPFFRDHNAKIDFSNNTITVGQTIIQCLPLPTKKDEDTKL